MDIISDEALLTILRLLDSANVASASMTNRRLNTLAQNAYGWNVQWLPRTRSWRQFCAFMLSNQLRLDSVRHVTIAGDWAGTPPSSEWHAARNDTILFIQRCQNITSVSCIHNGYSTLARLLNDSDPISHNPFPFLRHLHVDILPQLKKPSFASITHLSVDASVIFHYEDLASSAIFFHSLISFVGPLSAFIALSHHHLTLRHVVLERRWTPYCCPSWVNMWDETDLLGFFAALRRIECHTLIVGITWSDSSPRSKTFWDELAKVTPHLEVLGLTMDHCGNEIDQQRVCTLPSNWQVPRTNTPYRKRLHASRVWQAGNTFVTSGFT